MKASLFDLLREISGYTRSPNYEIVSAEILSNGNYRVEVKPVEKPDTTEEQQ